MKRDKTILVRSPQGFLSTNTVGTDGLNAIESIPGANDVKLKMNQKTMWKFHTYGPAPKIS